MLTTSSRCNKVVQVTKSEFNKRKKQVVTFVKEVKDDAVWFWKKKVCGFFEACMNPKSSIPSAWNYVKNNFSLRSITKVILIILKVFIKSVWAFVYEKFCEYSFWLLLGKLVFFYFTSPEKFVLELNSGLWSLLIDFCKCFIQVMAKERGIGDSKYVIICEQLIDLASFMIRNQTIFSSEHLKDHLKGVAKENCLDLVFSILSKVIN